MGHITRVSTAVALIMAMVVASLALAGWPADEALARGPAYPGPQTTAEGPAFFGPAPNPLPYCDNPTYFDPWEENITPTGRLDVGDTATVTTDGMTMVLEIQSEGDPGGQYPGFFPFGGEGIANDRAKGFEVASGDGARITLSQPLFYGQFIFTDVDQPGEGFEVIPDWAVVGEVIAYGGDDQFTFDGTTNELIVLDDVDGVAQVSESVNGRVQLDMLGAVNGITFLRPATRIDPQTGQELTTQGQSGLSVAGGCEASGAAKTVVAGPTWNGQSFEVTYELRFRNNMPTEETILAVVETAQANAQSTFSTAPPASIPLADIRLQDQLADPAFAAIAVTNISSSTPNLILNQAYDGLQDDELLDDGSFLAAESEGLISLTVEYTPDTARAEWTDCVAGYNYENQSEVSGTVGGIAVSDLSDDGIDPTPSSENGAGGVDDPTPVLFPCLPAGLDIVKTVVNGPNGSCPSFANGVAGPGDALPVTVDQFVTYCISVRNPGVGTANSVVVTDPQAPNSFGIGPLAAGQERSVSYDIRVDPDTPETNTATATGTSALGDLGPVSDNALISVRPVPEPELQIVKTALRPNQPCPDFDGGTMGRGDAVPFVETEFVTYCISVRNVGDGDATDVTITDDQAPNSFDLSVGPLAAGAEATRSFELEVSVQTEPVNIAFANANGPLGPISQVSDEAVIAVRAQPDPVLEIVKTVLEGSQATCPAFDDGVPGDGPALQVFYGDVVTYCLSVINSGANDATSVQVVDPQAPSVFSIGALAMGAQVTRSYEIAVDAETDELNTATVTGSGPNGQLPPASDTAIIDPLPQPDPELEIVKTVVEGPGGTCPSFSNGIVGPGDPLAVLYGDVVSYCISVRNSGAGAATNVVITDEQAPQDFEIGALGIDGVETVTYDITVDAETEELNTAVVNGDGPNGELPEASDTARIDPSPQPDPVLKIVKTVVPGPTGDCPDHDAGISGVGEPLTVNLGETVTYCISVRNTGASDATNVVITDEQAPALYEIGTLAADATADRSYDLVIEDGTPLRNVATVTGEGPNGELPEDDDSAEIRTPEANLGIDKTVSDRGPVPVGTVLTYTLQVTNNGPDAAEGVEVIDVLPAGLAYEALPSTEGWACSLEGQQGFRCLKGTDLASGESATLSYTVSVVDDAVVGVDLENTATVDARTDDPDESDNTDTEITRTGPPAVTEPPDTRLEYPGPFTTPEAPAEPTELPDEVLGLAITGSSSRQLGLLSAAMLAMGALLMVGARRTQRKEVA